MKRIIRILARLYPAPWRARYGAEFDQLLADSKPGWRDAMDVSMGAMIMQFTRWGYGRFASAGLALGLTVALTIAFLIPQEWRSEALLSGPADPGRWAQIQRETPEVMSRGFLAILIQRRGLYPGDRQRYPLEDIIAGMRTHIRMTRRSEGTLEIQFQYPDPILAQRVVADLSNDLVDRMGGSIHIVDFASLPIDPSSTSRAAIAGGGLLTGMFGGLVFAYFFRRRQHAATCPTCGHRCATEVLNVA
jgi:hypothetical protein